MSKTTNALVALGIVAGLGAAALPLSSYAVDPAAKDVGVTLKIEDLLEIEADKDNADNKVDLTGAGHTGDVKITVKTNNQTGYNLDLKGSAGKGEKSELTSENGDVIAATAGTFAAPAALSTSTSEWGYSVANANATLTQFTGGVYAGVTDAGQEIIKTSAPTGDAGDVTTITFAASIKDGQPAGTYDGQVTFTATNNVIPQA